MAIRYTLRQIEIFLAAAEFNNISRAAEHLGMSQSAASGALKELEHQFDTQLFDRVGKRLQINEQGKILRPDAIALMEQALGIERSLRESQAIGDIKVGATLTIGNYMAVAILQRFKGEYPNSHVDLDIENTEEITQKVLNFSLDIGLIEGEYAHPDLNIVHWWEDDLVVFCAPDHPLASKICLNDIDITEATWVLRESGSGTRQSFDRAMAGLLPNLKIELVLQQTEAIKVAVKRGMGISCLSKLSLQDEFSSGSLIPLKVEKRNLHRNFYFVTHKSKFMSNGIREWIRISESYVKSKS